jgi:[ribosomal protein S5]-alanine N-acetyltransferase
MGEDVWGRGIATCALRGLMRHAFASFSVLNRLFANVDADHPASLRVLQKAGLRPEGKLIGSAQKGGRIVDQFVYAITRDEAEVLFK